jgi:hypothetical protein
MSDARQVFGIGLSKTGTTSLTRALQVLGYRTKHFPFFHLDFSKRHLALNLKKISRWEALTDTPIPYFYKQLDETFPGSKFVLTVRDLGAWLRSCARHHVWPGTYVHDKAVGSARYVRSVLQLHRALYGTVSFDEQTFREHYQRHVDGVIDYFKARPQDLLVIDIERGEGWDRLCPFLGKEIPAAPFPRANIGARKRPKRTLRKYFWATLRACHFGRSVESDYSARPLSSDDLVETREMI